MCLRPGTNHYLSCTQPTVYRIILDLDWLMKDNTLPQFWYLSTLPRGLSCTPTPSFPHCRFSSPPTIPSHLCNASHNILHLCIASDLYTASNESQSFLPSIHSITHTIFYSPSSTHAHALMVQFRSLGLQIHITSIIFKPTLSRRALCILVWYTDSTPFDLYILPHTYKSDLSLI